MLHAAHAAHNGHKKILNHRWGCCCPGHDVVVLAVALARTLKEETEVWVSFGTRKAFCFLVHEIAQALGPDKAQALPRFHALRGCDVVSCFAWHGKSAWAVWTDLPELTQTLTFLSAAPDHIDEDAMHTIIIRQNKHRKRYGQGMWQRHKLLAKKSNAQLIPPTSAALEQNVRWAVNQGGHVWVRPWFLHQHCHHWPTGVGSRSAACMNLPGQCYPKHPRSTGSLSLANARRAAWKSVSARRPDQSHHCAVATGSALRTELARLRWRFWTLPDSEQWTYWIMQIKLMC